jgi:hypothetical protein
MVVLGKYLSTGFANGGAVTRLLQIIEHVASSVHSESSRNIFFLEPLHSYVLQPNTRRIE